jgi:hypothetical protein
VNSAKQHSAFAHVRAAFAHVYGRLAITIVSCAPVKIRNGLRGTSSKTLSARISSHHPVSTLFWGPMCGSLMTCSVMRGRVMPSENAGAEAPAHMLAERWV